METVRESDRLVWVDIAKGICITLVVFMHSTLGVEKALGHPSLIHGFVEWARPFRMPDFFLISGLFLAARIDRPWRTYLDTKVVHFAYFYVLWLTIQLVTKAPALVGDEGVAGLLAAYAHAFVEPWGTLWFIYLLAVFFTAAKLAEPLPKWLVWGAAAVLHVIAPATGWLVADEFSSRFVFFYSGYVAAGAVLAAADRLGARPPTSLVGALLLWTAANWALVANGWAFAPGLDLLVSFAGIAAVVALSTLLSRRAEGRAIAYLGRNSISIYLAFPLFMAPTRVLLLDRAPWLGAEITSFAVAGASLVGALLLARAVAGSRLDFLFRRPAAFKLQQPAARLSPRTASV